MCSITEPRRATVSCKHLFSQNPTDRSNTSVSTSLSRRYIPTNTNSKRSTNNSSSRSIKSNQRYNESNVFHIPFSSETNKTMKTINNNNNNNNTKNNNKFFRTSLNPLSPVFYSMRHISILSEQKQDNLTSETKYPLLSETSDYGSSTDQDFQSIRQLSSQTNSSPLTFDFDDPTLSYSIDELTNHPLPFRRTSVASSSSSSSSSSTSPSSSMSNLSSLSSSSSEFQQKTSSSTSNKKLLCINNNNMNSNESFSCYCGKEPSSTNRKRNRFNSYPIRRYTTINFCENCQMKRTKYNTRSKYILNRQFKQRLTNRSNESTTKFSVDLTGLNIQYTIEYHPNLKCTCFSNYNSSLNRCKCLTMNDWFMFNSLNEYPDDVYYVDSNNTNLWYSSLLNYYDFYLTKTNDETYSSISFDYQTDSLVNDFDYFRCMKVSFEQQQQIDHLHFAFLVIQSPPVRSWFRLSSPTRNQSTAIFTVMNYNILCDKYATRRIYGYCPSWALKWEYRRKQILDELRSYSADIIALQEIETDQFHLYFLPELKKLGYDGVFSPKSRAKTMCEQDRRFVDGCAIFYRQSKFRLIKDYLVEFNQLAMSAANGPASHDMMNRVMTKDNIGLVAFLETKDDSYSDRTSKHSSNEKQMLFVCTAHIHWDPEYCDVKVIQTLMLLSELKSIMKDAMQIYRPHPNLSIDYTSVPLVLCGDFNSLPNSGVIELMRNGKISMNHADFKDLRYESYLKTINSIDNNSSENTDIVHHFKLQSAYETTSTPIMPYTNYTYDFKGIIDYVFYSSELMRVLGVLGPVDPEWLQSNRIFGCPHPNVPSDHFPLLVEFELNSNRYDRTDQTASKPSRIFNSDV